ncbi:cytochrome P450 4V2-like isoform X2 [Argiope bruennichi]|uniref:cytochrome P450 4V2-like isoform X2 n=1 Tax=Argiope bruennichi TaxID=94029 RepID=UPI0024943710|nr:cytochrome P450 4V2-like isoform X2 [Argiope bruennichi]
MLLMLTAFILAFVCAVIFRYSLWRKECSKRMPGKTPGFFNILGDVKDFIVSYAPPRSNMFQEKLFDLLRKRTEEFGKKNLFCLWMIYQPIVIIVGSEAVKFMEKKINHKHFMYEWFEQVIGTGLLNSEVSKWKTRRKLLMPCFNLTVLRGFLSVFNEHSQKLVEILQERTKEEFTYIETPISFTTLDIIYETMFGVKINALRNDNRQYVRSVQRILDIFMIRFFKIWYWPNWIFYLSKEGKEMKRHVKIVHDFTRKIIHERKERYLSGDIEKDRGKRKALLDRLLEMHMETGEISEEGIREEVNTFALAGHETVTVTIIWALYLIGLHKDVQEKIHEELDRVFGDDTKSPVTEKDLNDLQYLDCVLKESMRLYPSVPWFGRRIPEDTNICGHTLPEGSACIIQPYFLHRDEEVFPDPERFNPERFSSTNIHKIPEYAYIPFSAGSRNCIGKTFAKMELKVIISSVLRNFSIESLDTRDKVQMLASITLSPSHPIRFRIIHRTIRKQH